MSPDLQSPEDFILNSVFIFADRFDPAIDITPVVIELNIYESIESIFLTGDIVFLDDVGISSAVRFSGTEKVQIEVTLPTPGSQIFTKRFVVSSVKNETKVNDHSAVITLSLIEESGFVSQIKKFSKAYDGRPEQILEKICTDQLQRSLIVDGTPLGSIQEAMRVVVPYMTVEQSLHWILDKATTSNGSPFFLYSSLISDSLILTDLDTMLSEIPFNSREPLIYSSSLANAKILNLATQARLITTIKTSTRDDTLNFSKAGLLSSNYAITQIDNNITRDFHHNIFNAYERLEKIKILEATQENPVLDEVATFNDKPLSDYNSKYFHQVTFSTYDNISNYYEDPDFSITKQRLVSKSFENLLHKNTIEVNMPGMIFLLNDNALSVGRGIQITVLKNKIENNQNSSMEDKALSGGYVIFNKRHLFSTRGGDNRHVVSLYLCRLTQEDAT